MDDNGILRHTCWSWAVIEGYVKMSFVQDFPRPIVANAGEIEKERVIFRVHKDTALNRFALFCCVKSDGTAVKSGPVVSGYWYGNVEVKKGDIIVLYTKSGKWSKKTAEDETTSYFYYWSKSSPLWIPEHRAVLMSTPTWTFAEDQPHEDDSA